MMNNQDNPDIATSPAHKDAQRTVPSHIVEEVQKLNRQMHDPKDKPFTKSTYWHQHASPNADAKLQEQLHDLSSRLARIEAKLDAIRSTP